MPITLAVDQLRIGWLPVPDPLVRRIVGHLDPSAQIARLPVRVLVGPLAIRPGRIEIGGGAR